LWVFSRFLGYRRNFQDDGDGEAAGWRDHGKSGIPGEVADSGAGAARGERRWPERWWAVPAGFAACAPRKREREKMIGILGRRSSSAEGLKDRAI
jgi:hypothetical protein